MQNEKGHAAACLNETFRQNADSPYLDRVRTGDGRSFLGSSQPGTRTPSQSGFRHRDKCFLFRFMQRKNRTVLIVMSGSSPSHCIPLTDKDCSTESRKKQGKNTMEKHADV